MSIERKSGIQENGITGKQELRRWYVCNNTCCHVKYCDFIEDTMTIIS